LDAALGDDLVKVKNKFWLKAASHLRMISRVRHWHRAGQKIQTASVAGGRLDFP
jgi:hypothetical protein